MTTRLSLAVAGTVLLLDQITKALITERIPLGSRTEILPGLFRLVHTRNRGVAFGLFDSSSHIIQIVLLVVVIGIVLFLFTQLVRTGHDGIAMLGFALVLGGALGNLADRLLRGEVVDFLEAYLRWGGREHAFPAFNVADSAISVGAALVILAEILRGRRRANPAPRSEPEA